MSDESELPSVVICSICRKILKTHCKNANCSWMTCGEHFTRMTDGHVAGTPFPNKRIGEQ